MKRTRGRSVGIVIDKLTRSIENAHTHERFSTELVRLSLTDSTMLANTNWLFDWLKQLSMDGREIYGLRTFENPDILHGLVSLSIEADHVFIHLLENALFNRGRNRQYAGVGGNLFAFACLRSFELGFDGNVVFNAKTQLIEHYESTLEAKRFRGQRMFIETDAARKLVDRYFKNEQENRL